MTLENTLDRITELQELKNDYLNMIDICTFSDMLELELDNINAEIRSLQTQLKYTLEYFTEKKHNGLIIGFKYYNGYRIVKEYVKTLYAGRILYTLDYTHARIYQTKQAANYAYNRMVEFNNNSDTIEKITGVNI